jgi:hypothetical protein
MKDKVKYVKFAAYAASFFTAVGMWLSGNHESAIGIVAAALTGVQTTKE